MKWFWIILLFPGLVFAGENCATFGGTCKDSCSENEIAEPGAFVDCRADQECCVKRKETELIDLKCCIYSFNSRDFSKTNCVIPDGNVCLKGTGSPVKCSELEYCKEKL